MARIFFLRNSARHDQTERSEVLLAVDATLEDFDRAVTCERGLRGLPPRPEFQDEDDDDGEDDGTDDDLAGTTASKEAQHGRFPEGSAWYRCRARGAANTMRAGGGLRLPTPQRIADLGSDRT